MYGHKSTTKYPASSPRAVAELADGVAALALVAESGAASCAAHGGGVRCGATRWWPLRRTAAAKPISAVLATLTVNAADAWADRVGTVAAAGSAGDGRPGPGASGAAGPGSSST